MRAYVIAMVIRTLSFPLAVWAFLSDQLVLGWILMFAAVLIPSVAVGVANAVDHRGEGRRSEPVSPVQGLGPAATTESTATPTTTPTSGDVVEGQIVQGTVVQSHVVPRKHAS